MNSAHFLFERKQRGAHQVLELEPGDLLIGEIQLSLNEKRVYDAVGKDLNEEELNDDDI
jgi:hypothetical protein